MQIIQVDEMGTCTSGTCMEVLHFYYMYGILCVYAEKLKFRAERRKRCEFKHGYPDRAAEQV